MGKRGRIGKILLAGQVLAGLSAPGVLADWPNLIANGELDYDEIPWQANDGDATLQWNTVDHAGCGDLSGSALAENAASGPLVGRNFTMCFGGILPGATYSFGTEVRFPTGQARSGSVAMQASWSEGVNCEGSFLGLTAAFPTWTTADSGVWLPVVQNAVVAPADAASVTLRIALEKNEAGGNLQVRFDGVYLVRVSGFVFSDGFTNDSVCRWSVDLP